MTNEITNAIRDNRLREAICLLSEQCAQENEGELMAEAETLRTNYGYLMDYYSKGVDDPERERIFQQIKGQIHLLASRLHWHRYSKNQTTQLIRRYQKEIYRSYSQLLSLLVRFGQERRLVAAEEDTPVRKEHFRQLYDEYETYTDELFYKAYSDGWWTDQDLKEATDLLTAFNTPAAAVAVMVSGITLNLCQLLDPKKLEFLINASLLRGDAVVSLRALVGVMLCTELHRDAMCCLPALQKKLQTLQPMSVQAFLVAKQFVIARQTEEINKHMSEDLLPTLMQSARYTVEKLNQNKDIPQSLEELEDESNPEWQKAYHKIQNGIQELCNLQMEGADTYFSTFQQLKNTRYFYQLSRWFYPFDPQLPEVSDVLPAGTIERGSVLHSMLHSSVFCDSDKYAFALSIGRLSKDQRRFMASAQGSEAIGMEMGMPAEDLSPRKPHEEAVIVIRSYVEDLYRYCKIWHFRNEVRDVFGEGVQLETNPLLKGTLLSERHCYDLANLLFEKGHPQEALNVYTELLQQGEYMAIAELWQKVGYIRQKASQPDAALQALLRADMLQSNDVWTLKHIAQCYRDMAKTEEALHYYRQVEALRPDELSTQLQIAQLLVVREAYTEALKYWFKLEYFEKYPEKVYRGIGWCYLMNGRHEDALRYYLKLKEKFPLNDDDWLNIGHLYRLMQQQQQAVDAYLKACTQAKDIPDFRRKLYNDYERFGSAIGLNATDVAIIGDVIEELMTLKEKN